MSNPRINNWPEKIPSYLFTGNAYFRIEVVDKCTDENTELYGCTDWDSNTIEIQRGLTEINFIDTLFHEILHVILDTFGLGQNTETNGCISISNENLVLKLTKGILIFWELNTKLFNYIFNGLEGKVNE